MSEHADQLYSFARKLGAGTVHDMPHLGWGIAIGNQAGVLVGHSDGAVIGDSDAKEVARELIYIPGFSSVRVLFLCACNSGRGAFASRLYDVLGGQIEIWAPTTAVMAIADVILPVGDSGNIIDPSHVASTWTSYC